MSKVAILTDSNSGMTQDEAKRLGIACMPMPFRINGEEYLEDINLSQEQFYEFLMNDADVSTSQPSVGTVKGYYDRLLEDHDEIVHIPMSSGLSSTYQTASMISHEEEYEGKVFVVNSQRISGSQKYDALNAKKMADQGMSGQEISDLLTKTKMDTTIYITLETLYYLEKGGRLTPAAAAMGKLLKIKPVLTIQGDKLDSFKKTRTVAKGKDIMLEATINDINERIDPEGKGENVDFIVHYTYDRQLGLDFRDQILEAFPGKEIPVEPLSLSVSCHIGPNSVAVICCKKILQSS